MNTFCPSVLVEKMCLSNLSLSFSSAAIISIDYTLRNNISSRRGQGSFAYCVASDQNGFAMGKFCWTLTSFSIVKTHVRLPDVSQWIRTKKKKKHPNPNNCTIQILSIKNYYILWFLSYRKRITGLSPSFVANSASLQSFPWFWLKYLGRIIPLEIQ